MIVYGDILKRLAENGYTSYRMRKEKILPEGTLTRLRNGETITTATIDVLCRLCGCQPGDFLEYIKDE